MRNPLKAGILVLWTILFLISFSASTFIAAKPKFGKIYPSNGSMSIVSSPVDLSYMKGVDLSLSPPFFLSDYPSSVDLRALLNIPVRDQGMGNCSWAFAAMTALEYTQVYSNDGSIDFSENHLKNTHGFDPVYNAGGNHFMSTAYLTRWSGPVSETKDPYNPKNGVSPSNLTAMKHLQCVYFLPGRGSKSENKTIRSFLANLYPVYTYIFWKKENYRPETQSYYYDGYDERPSNLAVLIVGYDDDYSPTRFISTNAPQNKGAYLVRTSFGRSFGDNGYMWVSYDDFRIGESNACFGIAEKFTNYGSIYQYDPYGWTGNFLPSPGANSIWISNIYTATSENPLAAVGVYIVKPNTNYRISIYTGVQSSPNSGTQAYFAQGAMKYPGFQTIPLSVNIPLVPGKKFAVVLKLMSPSPCPAAFESRIIGYSSAAAAAPGQSFYSSDGFAWNDLTNQDSSANFCIKAYTKFALPIDIK